MSGWTVRPHAGEPWLRDPCHCVLYQDRWLVARASDGGFILKDRKTGVTERMSETTMASAMGRVWRIAQGPDATA